VDAIGGRSWIVAALFATAVLAGCSQGGGPVDVPQEGRVERKEYKDMSVEEKIDFINKTPMPEEAKRKQIESIRAGRS